MRGLKVGDGLTKLFAILHIGGGVFERLLRSTNAAGGDIDPAPVEAVHGDGETLAFFAKAVFFRYAHIVKGNRAGGLGIPAHLMFVLTVANAVDICGH